MLVRILSFGSSWWPRFGHDPQDRYRFTRHAAYFNSTGVRSGSKVRRYWIVPGLLRFNGVGDFNPQFPARSIGASFECASLTIALGGNRLLFGRKVKNAPLPDCYLIAIKSEACGIFDCRLANWKSETVRPLAISQHGEKSEALVLMGEDDWIRTRLGIWTLTPKDSRHDVVLVLGEGSD